MYRLENHGSLDLFRPLTDECREHLETRCPDAQWLGGALAVEPRYTDNLMTRLHEHGFTCDTGDN